MDSFCDDSAQKVNDSSVHTLLEDGWFFGKVLDSKPRMLRWYSDPSPRIGPDILAGPSSDQRISSAKLSRSPSLPPLKGGENERDEGSCRGGGKLSRQLSVDRTLVRKVAKQPNSSEKKGMERSGAGEGTRRNNLLRTPSLPPWFGREEEEDSDGDEISMSRLIRQAMPTASDFLPPRRTSNKCMMQISTMPKSRPSNSETSDEQKHRRPTQKTLKKSVSNIVEFHRVLNDEDFKFDSNSTNRNDHNLNRTTKACIPESWRERSCAPPVPVWNSKDSAEHMKAQLKFWARAVASNVR